MSTRPLPSSAAFITQLLGSLGEPSSEGDNADGRALNRAVAAQLQPTSADSSSTSLPASNPLASASQELRNRLLTLQVLFPNEFLPALDLLDRRLVERRRVWRPRDKNGSGKSGSEGRNGAQSNGGESHELEGHIDAADVKRQAPKSRNESVGNAYVSHEPNNPPHALHEESFPNEAETTIIGAGVPEDMRLPDLSALPLAPATNPTPTPTPQRPFPTSQLQHLHYSPGDSVYYVRSAQQHQRPSRYASEHRGSSQPAYYEVRLRAWNCSCPAFAFAAFPGAMFSAPGDEDDIDANDLLREVRARDSEQCQQTGLEGGEREKKWRFGGVSLGYGIPPVCKHLLACALVEYTRLFGGFVSEVDVQFEEAAAWAAGWAD